jgi:midasin (ATPase involved in ribosome maturation)
VVIVSEVLSGAAGVDSPQSLAHRMVDFTQFVEKQSALVTVNNIEISIRELIAWARFIMSTKEVFEREGNSPAVATSMAYVHGAYLAILDGLGAGLNIPRDISAELKSTSLTFLLDQCQEGKEELQRMFRSSHVTVTGGDDTKTPSSLYISSFAIPKGPSAILQSPSAILQSSPAVVGSSSAYVIDSPHTATNMYRIARAMQLARPVLLEGPPGVGKSSVVACLAALAGHRLVRINLSEHTELSDLLGADLPTSNEGDDGSGPRFKWVDGVFLQALKRGDWVLLDEMNLAPQAVLEGLNACFDHREEVFIPEIGLRFHRAPSFRVFCAQNPMGEGGRRGLPKSFLTRFTRVYLDAMTETDMTDICSKRFLQLPTPLVSLIPRVVALCQRLQLEIVSLGNFGRSGTPWEFNLRDCFRIFELLDRYSSRLTLDLDEEVIQVLTSEVLYLLLVARMRSKDDRAALSDVVKDMLGFPLQVNLYPTMREVSLSDVSIGLNEVRCGGVKPVFSPTSRSTTELTDSLSKTVDLLAGCVHMNWPSLLVASSGAGKRRAVTYLAEAMTARLVNFPVTPTTDTTELLGSFEQCSEDRVFTAGVQLLERAVGLLLEPMLRSQPGVLREKLSESVLVALSSVEVGAKAARKSLERKSLRLADGQLAYQLLQEAMLRCVDTQALCEDSEALKESRVLLEAARDKLQRSLSIGQGAGGGFEWIDGVVVRAVEQGHWLLVENVNLCPASVLDRLNSLLETNGQLLLSESGEHRVITPHPSFRIFFTMDPLFGEISRALRNRCVELFILADEDINEEVFESVTAQQGVSSSEREEARAVYRRLVSASESTRLPVVRTFSKLLAHANTQRTFSSWSQAVHDAISSSLGRLLEDYNSPLIETNSSSIRISSSLFKGVSVSVSPVIGRLLSVILHPQTTLGYPIFVTEKLSIIHDVESRILKLIQRPHFSSEQLAPYAVVLLVLHGINSSPLARQLLLAICEKMSPQWSPVVRDYLSASLQYSQPEIPSCDLYVTRMCTFLSARRDETSATYLLLTQLLHLPRSLVEDTHRLSVTSSSRHLQLQPQPGQKQYISLYALGWALREGLVLQEDLHLNIVHCVFTILVALTHLSSGLTASEIADSSARSLELVFTAARARDQLCGVLLHSLKTTLRRPH